MGRRSRSTRLGRPWQTGDDEARFLFAPEALAAVAAVIRARRRGIRVMTPEALAVLAAGRQKALAVYPSATSRPQDRAGAIRTALPMLVARATG